LDNINQGLMIFGVGMLVLFVALGLLALMIDLLGKAFKEKTVSEDDSNRGGAAQAPIPPSSTTEGAAVAVAVVVSHLLSQRAGSSELGKLLEPPPGR